MSDVVQFLVTRSRKKCYARFGPPSLVRRCERRSSEFGLRVSTPLVKTPRLDVYLGVSLQPRRPISRGRFRLLASNCSANSSLDDIPGVRSNHPLQTQNGRAQEELRKVVSQLRFCQDCPTAKENGTRGKVLP